jgi:Domain of unknown function (DUF1902)
MPISTRRRLPLAQIAYDREAKVWIIVDSAIPGLSGEADTKEALIARLPGLIADLLEENGVAVKTTSLMKRRGRAATRKATPKMLRKRTIVKRSGGKRVSRKATARKSARKVA